MHFNSSSHTSKSLGGYTKKFNKFSTPIMVSIIEIFETKVSSISISVGWINAIISSSFY